MNPSSSARSVREFPELGPSIAKAYPTTCLDLYSDKVWSVADSVLEHVEHSKIFGVRKDMFLQQLRVSWAVPLESRLSSEIVGSDDYCHCPFHDLQERHCPV